MRIQVEEVLTMEDEFMMNWLEKSAWSFPKRDGSERVVVITVLKRVAYFLIQGTEDVWVEGMTTRFIKKDFVS